MPAFESLVHSALIAARSFSFGDFVLVWIVIGILEVVLFLVALISIVGSKHYTGGGKFLWFLLILAYPLLGSLGWLIGGRKAQIVKS